MLKLVKAWPGIFKIQFTGVYIIFLEFFKAFRITNKYITNYIYIISLYSTFFIFKMINTSKLHI